MKILMVNDDGIHADGLISLAKTLVRKHDITIIAPEEQRSAYSHSFTLYTDIGIEPVRIEELGDVACYKISGTPADCTKLGILYIMDEKPDLVISGINKGANLGTDIAYSGTVGAAFEATLFHCRAIAVSQYISTEPVDYTVAVEFTDRFIDQFDFSGIPDGTILNVNVPDLPRKKIGGVLITRQGVLNYEECYVETQRSDLGYRCRLTGKLQRSSQAGTDVYAIQRGYISISPLKFNRTDLEYLNKLNKSAIQ